MQEGKKSKEQIEGRIKGAMKIYSIHTGSNSKAIQKIPNKHQTYNGKGKIKT